MLAGGYSWRLFFYVEFAFAMGLLVLAFFFVEETRYKRKTLVFVDDVMVDVEAKTTAESAEVADVSPAPSIPPRKSFVATLSLWSGIDRESPFFMMMLRSFTYFLVPSVFWVVTTYGRIKEADRY